MTDINTGAELVITQGWFAEPQTHAFLVRNQDRMQDISGDEIAEVMPHVGWHFTGDDRCAYAQINGMVIAMAWAAPMQLVDGRYGMNLTYATDKNAGGLGLATLLASLAFRAADADGLQEVEFVSAQLQLINLASARVATSLGLKADSTLGFACSTSTGELAYCGYSSPVNVFRAEAARRVSERTQMARIREREIA